MDIDKTRLLSRRQIGELLQHHFWVKQKVETLKILFAKDRMDIEKLAMDTDPETGRGQVGLYDPLVVWVMATYFHWPKLAYLSPTEAMWLCVNQATARRGGVDDAATRRLAYYLYISDERWGLDLRVLDSALASRPELLEYTLDGADTLKNVLLIYKEGFLRNALGHDVAEVRLASEYAAVAADEAGHWPFFKTDWNSVRDVMKDAGLYEPAEDTLPDESFDLARDVRRMIDENRER